MLPKTITIFLAGTPKSVPVPLQTRRLHGIAQMGHPPLQVLGDLQLILYSPFLSR